MMDTLVPLAKSIVDGDDETASRLTGAAIDAGTPAKQILDEGLLAGMATVGGQFKAHEIFLPDVLMAARAMHAAMELLKPLLDRGGVASMGKIVVGSVQGDLHDIGKNLVGVMLKGAGFEVIDLGSDVSPERFIEQATAEGASVIGMSALLTTTMPVMRSVVELVRERGLVGKVRTIVGGAPVSADFAREIGADAYGFDAASAVDHVKRLTGLSADRSGD